MNVTNLRPFRKALKHMRTTTYSSSSPLLSSAELCLELERDRFIPNGLLERDLDSDFEYDFFRNLRPTSGLSELCRELLE